MVLIPRKLNLKTLQVGPWICTIFYWLAFVGLSTVEKFKITYTRTNFSDSRSEQLWLQNIFFYLFLHVSKSQFFFSNLNYNCSNLLDMRNIQERIKKACCYQKLFWPFTVWTNCSSDCKIFANSWSSASNFKICLDH